MDDLRMAVEEAAVLLLRHGDGDPLELLTTIGDDMLTIELSTAMADPSAVIDPSSFSWMILQALTDDLSASVDGGRARLTMVKHDRQHDHVEHVEGRG